MAKSSIHQEIEASHLLSNLEMVMLSKVCISLFVKSTTMFYRCPKNKYLCVKSTKFDYERKVL